MMALPLLMPPLFFFCYAIIYVLRCHVDALLLPLLLIIDAVSLHAAFRC